MNIFEGRCWKFGDNIPTDRIVRVDRALGSMEEMAKHVLEDLRPEFPVEVKNGDILVAGIHFGQSSGRAVAPKAIKATGISVVVCEYASRLFTATALRSVCRFWNVRVSQKLLTTATFWRLTLKRASSLTRQKRHIACAPHRSAADGYVESRRADRLRSKA